MYGKSKVVYANVWECPELNKKALDIQPEDRVLSITSGGCNSLNLLLENPKKVISIDVNPGQVALLDLKMAAIKHLSHSELWALMGAKLYREEETASPDWRLVIYGGLRDKLPELARRFWDQNLEGIRVGLLNCGSVEKFFNTYRMIIRSLYRFDNKDDLFFYETVEEQREAYKKVQKTKGRALNHLILNKFLLGLVKGKHSFRFVENLNFGKNFNEKLRYAFNNILLRDNYFMQHIFLGAYVSPESAPPYLRPSNFKMMKERIDRLENRMGTLQDVLEQEGRGSIEKFNLSNIFEWFDTMTFNDIFQQVLELASEKARLCFRYTLASPQSINDENKQFLTAEVDLAKELHKQDRAFMYESFHIYQVNKSETKKKTA